MRKVTEGFSRLSFIYWLLKISRRLYWFNILFLKGDHLKGWSDEWFQLCVALKMISYQFCIALSQKHYIAISPVLHWLTPPLFFPRFDSLYLCFSFSLNFFLSFSMRLFWKRCQHCCFYTKRLLLSDGWRQPQLQRRACVCLAAEGRSHWKGQNCEALLVTAMKTLTSTNRIAISNNCTIYSEWLR